MPNPEAPRYSGPPDGLWKPSPGGYFAAMSLFRFRTVSTALFVALFLLPLGACDSSTGSEPPFSEAVQGSWKADTGFSVTVGAIPVRAVLGFTVELASDGSFQGSVALDSVLGNVVTGSLYRREGTWRIASDTLFLEASTCSQAVDTTLSLLGTTYTLPFYLDAAGAFHATALATTDCGAPDTVTTRPSGSKWNVPLRVTLPDPLPAGTLPLLFRAVD